MSLPLPTGHRRDADDVGTAFLRLGLDFGRWNRTCRLLGTVTATCGLYLVPVVTAVVAALALDETMTPLTSLGAVLTLAGVIVSGR